MSLNAVMLAGIPKVVLESKTSHVDSYDIWRCDDGKRTRVGSKSAYGKPPPTVADFFAMSDAATIQVRAMGHRTIRGGSWASGELGRTYFGPNAENEAGVDVASFVRRINGEFAARRAGRWWSIISKNDTLTHLARRACFIVASAVARVSNGSFVMDVPHEVGRGLGVKYEHDVSKSCVVSLNRRRYRIVTEDGQEHVLQPEQVARLVLSVDLA